MERPWLIQRCELGDGRLLYEYMGSFEFECGDQSRALQRIFAPGAVLGSVTVTVGGREMPVYLVAAKGFQFPDYQPYLQQLADYRLPLQERTTNFDYALKIAAGLPVDQIPRTNVWFDFENDVIWTLSLSDREALLAVLENIQKSWKK